MNFETQADNTTAERPTAVEYGHPSAVGYGCPMAVGYSRSPLSCRVVGTTTLREVVGTPLPMGLL